MAGKTNKEALMGEIGIEKSILRAFGRCFSRHGMVVRHDGRGRLVYHGGRDKGVIARWSGGKVLDSRCVGASVLSGGVFAVYQESGSSDVSIQEFKDNSIFGGMR